MGDKINVEQKITMPANKGSLNMSGLKSSAREFVLVVLGVLLAFGIQSQWEARQERREVSGYLTALRSELLENRAQLVKRQQVLHASIATADTLQKAWLRDVRVEKSQLPRLIWVATGISGGTFRYTALESLTRSTSWAQLQDPNLQLALSRLEFQLAEVRSNADAAITFWFEASEPFLRDMVSYDEWERATQDPLNTSIDAEVWVGLLSDLRLQNLITHASWFSKVSLEGTNRVVEEIDRALTLMVNP